MKQITDPRKLKWFSASLPDPVTVHPDCRIVVWQNHHDLERSTTLIIGAKSYYVAGNQIFYYWITSEGKTLVDKNQNVFWAWWKSFH